MIGEKKSHQLALLLFVPAAVPLLAVSASSSFIHSLPERRLRTTFRHPATITPGGRP